MDVVYHRGLHGRVCLDISLVNSAAEAAIHGRAFKAALQRRERAKHRRYPFPGLVPFVLDVNGRWGMEAETWLRRVLGDLPDSERNAARVSLRSSVARALHSQVAEQIALATILTICSPLLYLQCHLSHCLPLFLLFPSPARGQAPG